VAATKKSRSLERDWDPQKIVLVRNASANNVLLELPTGRFRLDAGQSYRMTADIADLQQVKDLVAAGLVEIARQ
jgi:hypothetical protein